METIIRQIVQRQDFGDVLARGVKRAAQSIGRSADKYAYHVKGVELYGGDPRGMMGIALAYAVSMRGGDFTRVYPLPEFRYTAEQA
jgi:aldehyde:ferredoxin oxidoreductase